MIATLSQSLAELPKFVELVSRGEDALITVDGQPKAKLTRADGANTAANWTKVDLSTWLTELEDLRRRYSTGKSALAVEQILDEDRADRL
jgi:hypothetical protein